MKIEVEIVYDLHFALQMSVNLLFNKQYQRVLAIDLH